MCFSFYRFFKCYFLYIFREWLYIGRGVWPRPNIKSHSTRWAWQLFFLQGTNLVGIDYYFALFLVSACDEQHVVERRRVIENWVIFEGIEYVAGWKFEQMDTSLIDSHPQSLGPIRGEWLLKIVKIIVNTFNKNNWVHKENFWLRVGQKFDFGGDILKIIVFCL